MQARQRGFTLPELLVVGGVLVVIIVIAAWVLDPDTDLVALRNAQRRTDLAQFVQGINSYHAEHGVLPPSITEEEQFIGSGENESDLCAELVPDYLGDIPFDPIGESVIMEGESLGSCKGPGSAYTTMYAVQRAGNNAVTLSALLTEAAEEIQLTRSYPSQ